MPFRRLQSATDETYFVTYACFNWLSLFERTDLYLHFDQWFNYLIREKVLIFGYVIMPNHFHGLLHLTSGCQKSLNTLIGNGKRFQAYEIVRRLREMNDIPTLKLLSENVDKKDLAANKKHEVFRDSFDWKQCHDRNMVETKLDYIHHNPVQGKWQLVDDWAMYPHSSAGFYQLGLQNPFITDYRDIWG